MKLSDQVLMRLVQVVQEAMLTGVDCADIMRQIDVVVDPDNQSQLVLSDDYIKMVREHHVKLVAEAERLKEEITAKKLLMDS